MATPETSETNSLIERVQSLPSELYEEIYNLTFTVNTETCYVDKAYRPPGILQVNKNWRSALRQRYYDKTIFRIPAGLNGVEHLTRWLTFCTQEHGRNIASPTLHILSEKRITTPIRRMWDKTNDLVMNRSTLVRRDQRSLVNLRCYLHRALRNAPRSIDVV